MTGSRFLTAKTVLICTTN